MLTLAVLGGFEARLDASRLAALPKKTQALLCYLALEDGVRPRAELATLLWGDTGDEQALQSLRKALSGLRQALGASADNILLVHDRGIGLNRAAIEVDALEFGQKTRLNEPAAVAEAAAIYKGHLLAGFDLDEGPFNEWLIARREELREIALNALSRLLDSQTLSGALDAGIETAQRILALEPLHEPAHRVLIQIYGRLGRRSAAARQYQICVDALSEQLGVAPEPATVAAYRASLASTANTEVHPAATIAETKTNPIMAAAPAAPMVLPLSPPCSARWRVATVVAVVVIVSMTGIAVFRDTPQAPRRTLAVAEIRNLSGQPDVDWLSQALRETVAATLSADSSFRRVPAEQVDRVLGPGSSTPLTRQVFDAIGRELGGELVLTGGYLAVNGQLRVDLQLVDTGTGQPVATATATDTDTQLLAVVENVSADLRRQLGLGRLAGGQRDAARAVMPAPDARRAYFLGLDSLRQRDAPRAASFLQEAIARDPGFALAHAALSTTWSLLGFDQRAADEAQAAMRHAAALSREDQLSIDALVFETTFNWAKAGQRYRELRALDPGNVEYGLKLGNVLQIDSKLTDAAALIDELRKLPPPQGTDPRIDLLDATVAEKTNDFTRALAIATAASDKAARINAPVLVARARIKQGINQHRLTQYADALQHFEAAERNFSEAGDRGGAADAIRWQGTTLYDMRRFPEADAKLAVALDMAAPMHYVRLITEVLIMLGSSARDQGDLQTAQLRGEEALTSARDGAELDAVARALQSLAMTLRARGELAAARQLYSEALDIYQRRGDELAVNSILNNRGVIDLLQGRLGEARTAYETLLAFERQSGSRGVLPLRLTNLALVLTMQGHRERALALTSEACTLYEQLQSPALLSCRIRLAQLQYDIKADHEARQTASLVPAAQIEKTTTLWDLARYARLMTVLDEPAAAASALARADRLMANGRFASDQVLRIGIAKAQLDGARGRRVAALARLDRTRRDAERMGFSPIAFEARVLAAELSDANASQRRALLADAAAAGLTGLIPARGSERWALAPSTQ